MELGSSERRDYPSSQIGWSQRLDDPVNWKLTLGSSFPQCKGGLNGVSKNHFCRSHGQFNDPIKNGSNYVILRVPDAKRGKKCASDSRLIFEWDIGACFFSQSLSLVMLNKANAKIPLDTSMYTVFTRFNAGLRINAGSCRNNLCL